jgi:hypothetical protein
MKRLFQSLVLLAALLFCPGAMPPGFWTQAAASGPSYPTQEELPAADTSQGTWGLGSGAVTMWGNIAYTHGNHGDGDHYISQFDHASTAGVVRVTLSSTGSIDHITVWNTEYAAIVSGITMQVMISNDNSTWSSPQTWVSTGTSHQTHSVSFSGLGWSSSTYVYVKLNTTSDTWNSMAIEQASIVLNPP